MGLFRRKGKGKDEVIDLAALEREQQEASEAPARVWGLPEPCPACGEPGYLDRIDPVEEVMTQHCPSCFHAWETSKAEVEAAS